MSTSYNYIKGSISFDAEACANNGVYNPYYKVATTTGSNWKLQFTDIKIGSTGSDNPFFHLVQTVGESGRTVKELYFYLDSSHHPHVFGWDYWNEKNSSGHKDVAFNSITIDPNEYTDITFTINKLESKSSGWWWVYYTCTVGTTSQTASDYVYTNTCINYSHVTFGNSSSQIKGTITYAGYGYNDSTLRTMTIKIDDISGTSFTVKDSKHSYTAKLSNNVFTVTTYTVKMWLGYSTTPSGCSITTSGGIWSYSTSGSNYYFYATVTADSGATDTNAYLSSVPDSSYYSLTNYTTDGYCNSSGKDISAPSTTNPIKITADTSLYIKLKSVVYTITYKTSGGTSITTQTYLSTSQITLLSSVSDSYLGNGQKISGWKADSSQPATWKSQSWDAGATISAGKSGDVTLTLTQTDVSFQIYYNVGSGVPTKTITNPVTLKYSGSTTLPSKSDITYSGYIFNGYWSTAQSQSSGGMSGSVTGSSFNTVKQSHTDGTKVQLYPVLTEAQVKVTFKYYNEYGKEVAIDASKKLVNGATIASITPDAVKNWSNLHTINYKKGSTHPRGVQMPATPVTITCKLAGWATSKAAALKAESYYIPTQAMTVTSSSTSMELWPVWKIDSTSSIFYNLFSDWKNVPPGYTFKGWQVKLSDGTLSTNYYENLTLNTDSWGYKNDTSSHTVYSAWESVLTAVIYMYWDGSWTPIF